eukprot:gnl/TRDRNA2_/TRDRNA2_170499_c0_seq2.p1 gnl/TRDRNA2_/TRDRNA2_170499_c0~~gnl/TRDRNA2_/TRDRNA2_170499_c0_seq2.p1  ORF type:complete len:344 (+),score=51.34 gnl/TRDRNA2_/TRDRNA2_170499_c0_seq2:187-1218(+)
MSLPVQEVGRLAGVEAGTPYLLNISDDPALSGCLLYFLRAEPAVCTVGYSGRDSIAANSIVLRGLGIPARLCEIRYRADPAASDVSITICKTCDSSGRLLVNGRPLETNDCAALKHGDRIVFGWAFCFRLVVSGNAPSTGEEADGPGGASAVFENASKEMLEYSMTSSMGGISMMRAVGHWQAELMRRSVNEGEVEQFLNTVGELMVQVEEASALASEAHKAMSASFAIEFDVGVCFSFISASRLPTAVVQVWKSGEGHARLLAAWTTAEFERRLLCLRDAHREVLALRPDPGRQELWAHRLSCEEWWAGDGRETPAPLDDEEPALDAEAVSEVTLHSVKHVL